MKNTIKKTTKKPVKKSILVSRLKSAVGLLTLSALVVAGLWGADEMTRADASVDAGISAHEITDDRALYRQLRQIRAQKQRDLGFDTDIKRLAKVERRFAEDLPAVDLRGRIMNPARRISRRPYRHSGSKRRATARRR